MAETATVEGARSEPVPEPVLSIRVRSLSRAFTLVELLITVAILGILTTILTANARQAIERTLKSSNAANLHTIATALQSYYVDYGKLPPADREAGPFMSHGPEFTKIGNGPAGGGSWDGLPWMLYEYGYVADWHTLFNPKYLRLYQGRKTVRGEYPRFHNFRYAYNSAALASGGHLGGAGNIMSGEVWLVRDLWVEARKGWFGSSYPDYPADYTFPWGEGDRKNQLEHALYSDMAVQLVAGGKEEPAP